VSVWGGPPLDLGKYTDAELAIKIVEVKDDILICEQHENWKKALLGERHWIEWELNRRNAARP